MIQYNLIYTFNEKLDTILMLRKSHPTWQKGKMSVPGGLMVEGRDQYLPHRIQEAMRELREETTITKVEYIYEVGMVTGKCVFSSDKNEDYELYIYAAIVTDFVMRRAAGTKDEPVSMWYINEVYKELKDKVVSNTIGFMDLALTRLNEEAEARDYVVNQVR